MAALASQYNQISNNGLIFSEYTKNSYNSKAKETIKFKNRQRSSIDVSAKRILLLFSCSVVSDSL